MSVIIGGDKLVIHSWRVPVLFNSIQEPEKKYAITSEDGWVEVPNHFTYKDIVWFRKEDRNTKNEAFKNTFEQEVDGSKGKKYTVKNEDNRWSCTCPAFGWSGNARTCKHIDKVKTDNGWN